MMKAKNGAAFGTVKSCYAAILIDQTDFCNILLLISEAILYL